MSEPSLAACGGDHLGKIGHEREPMSFDHHNRMFVCGLCGFSTTEESIRRAVPIEYAPWHGSTLVAAFQSMMDFRILVVFGRRGPHVEYPRPSLDEVR